MGEIGTSDHRAIGTLENSCSHQRITVIHTWRAGHIIRRRRECLDCHATFLTSETLPNRTNAKNRMGLRVAA
jgi:hypothetical protein